MLRLVALALTTLISCGNDPSCKQYAKDLGLLLERAAAEPPPLIQIPDDMTVAEAHDMPARRDDPAAPAVIVTQTTATYQGQPVATPELGTLLDAAHAKIVDDIESGRVPAKFVPDPDFIYFVIDVRAPWPLVVASVERAVTSGFTHVGLVYTMKSTITPPPRAAIDKQLDDLLRSEDASNKASELARIISDEVRSCPTLQKEFGRIGSDEAESKAMSLARSVEPALLGCDCRVNTGNLRSALFRVLYVEKPVRILRLSFEHPTAAHGIELPATALWGDAVRQLDPTTREVTFTVGPDR
jgi:hypothetical protein